MAKSRNAKRSKKSKSFYITPNLLIALAALNEPGSVLVDSGGMSPRMFCPMCHGYNLVDCQDRTPVQPTAPIDVIEDSIPCPMCGDNAGFGLEIPCLLQATGYGECVLRGDPGHWIITDAGRAVLMANK